MSHILDDTDKAILNLLQDDATLPLKTVAERVHVSIATAQRRIQALIDSGVITKQSLSLTQIRSVTGLRRWS